MWLRRVLLICCTIAAVLGEEDIITQARPGHEFVQIQSSLGGPAPAQARAIPIEEFVTSHKIPEGVSKPSDDDEVAEVVEEAKIAEELVEQIEKMEEDVKKVEKVQKKVIDIQAIEQSLDPVDQETSASKNSAKRQARVKLESFSDAGVLPEEGQKKAAVSRPAVKSEKDSVIPGVEVSAENPTTMVPVLTTAREYRAFDFVPVNIIREDSKDAYTPYADRSFGDLSDVSLVPAGTNSRIQVKKGPNGKDYEYEYVYYYYDEDDEGKAGSTSNSHDGPARTTPGPKRGASSNRNKYSSIERTSTVEPASNEVIPSRNTNRGRHIPAGEEVAEDRLPANTRFPPRSRSNHNTGTTEPSRVRGNRPRPNLDLVDSNSFRTNQEGPEFPHNLPKGPVRFLGVTPNEDNEEKPATRTRGRPQRVQEPAPVDEAVNEPVRPQRRRPVAAVPEVEIELSRGQPAHPADDEDEDKPAPEESAASEDTIKTETKIQEEKEESQAVDAKDTDESDITTTDVPTTENPLAMDKIALDLYAFSLQGQSNLIDAATTDLETDDITTISDEDETTEIPTTIEPETTTTEATTTTTTEPTTTTTTTTEPPTTTTQVPAGRPKFRRPGSIGGLGGKRNRLNSNTASTTSTEASAEPTQRTRGRYGSSTGGFKRPKPGQKQPVEEEVQKDTSSTVSAEKPTLPGRGRFRGTGSRSSIATTSAPSTASSSSSSSGSPSLSRPSFNKLNINRRRGRPTTAVPTTSEDTQETGETGETKAQETSTTTKPSIRPRLPGVGVRPRPGNRINLRLRPGQTTTTTAAPEEPQASAEEPAGEGTEEETHEAPVESSPAVPTTTANPLNRLKNRNRLQVQPKPATRSPAPLAPRRSPLLPRRKTTEAPVVETSSEEAESEEAEETEPTETAQPEPSTSASAKHEEIRGLSSLLAPRRRIAPRRPGQIISRD